MRGERFDRLVERVAGRRSRRAFLAGVAGTGMSRLSSPAFTPAAGAAQAVCDDKIDENVCPGGVDHAAIGDELMRTLPPSPTGCLPGDTPCDRDDACCTGICTMHGRCACFDTGHLCPADGYCCGGVCRDGRCVETS